MSQSDTPHLATKKNENSKNEEETVTKNIENEPSAKLESNLVVKDDKTIGQDKKSSKSSNKKVEIFDEFSRISIRN